jgi:hypothetical protein
MRQHIKEDFQYLQFNMVINVLLVAIQTLSKELEMRITAMVEEEVLGHKMFLKLKNRVIKLHQIIIQIKVNH